MRDFISRHKRATALAVAVMVIGGAAFALWNSRLPVDGDATTGAAPEVTWYDEVVPTVTHAGPGSCSVTMNPKGTDQTLHVSITGAKPGFVCTVDVDAQNVGTVDAAFERIEGIGDGAAIVTTSNLVCGDVLATGFVRMPVVFDIAVTDQSAPSTAYDLTGDFVWEIAGDEVCV